MTKGIKSLFLVFVFSILTSINLIAQPGWYRLTSPGNYSSVFFVDSLNGWLGGTNGISKTTDGGKTWTSQILPVTSGISRIVFLSFNIGLAVGNNGVILKTTNSGSTWIQKKSSTYRNMNSIYFLNSKLGWACGIDTVLFTTDQGETWSARYVSGFAHWDISFRDSQEGWVVGFYGLCAKTTDGGNSWNSVGAPIPGVSLFGICFPSPSKAIAIGGGQIALSTNGGLSWLSVYNSGGSQVNSVSFADSLNGWVVASDKIIKTTDGGSTWKEQLWPSPGYLLAVHGSDRFHAWVVGDAIILKTTNGGNSVAGSAIPIPELMLPHNGATQQLTSMNMSWNSIPNATQYYIQAATDSQFTHLVLNDSTYLATSWRISHLQLNTDYFWRICASTYAGRSDWSVAWKFKTVASFPESILFPLSIGTKWFYNSYLSNGAKGFIVREIIDTTANGFRTVSVKLRYRDSTSIHTSTEYWLYNGEGFYINDSPSFYNYPNPLFIALLTNDSIYGSGPITKSWGLQRESYFGSDYYSQMFSYAVNAHGGYYRYTRTVANGIGLTFSRNDTQIPMESSYIIGLLKDRVLFGDSSQTILSVRSEKHNVTCFHLSQNYPNPFNPTTTISFDLPVKSYVSLKLFDMLGKEVANLVSRELIEGTHSLQWTSFGLSSGVYIYRLQAGSFVETRKLVLLR